MKNRMRQLFSALLVLALFVSMMSVVRPVGAAPNSFSNPTSTIFINEIHYDNTGTDLGESIEIAGPAGTDLTGWSIVLYNGSNGAQYDSDPLIGTLPNQLNGYGTMVLSYPTNGIQNGAPDGIALVDSGNSVVQFLSYEGTFTAVEGPANGMLSTNIGVLENGFGAVGNSLQLTGTGSTYGEFTWAGEGANTFGSPNTGQIFGTPGTPVLVINELDYDQPGTDTAEFVEIKNVGTASADLNEYTLELVNGTGGGASLYQSFVLPAIALAAGDYFVICGNAANVPNCDLDVTPDSNLVQNGAPDGAGLRRNGTLVDAVSYEGDTGAPYSEGSGTGLEDNFSVDNAGISRYPDGTDTDQNNVDLSFRCSTPGEPNVEESADCVLPNTDLVINEVDYDQPGTDTAEFVEIRNNGDTTTDLSGWTLELVNGNGGAVYAPIDLTGYSLAAGDYFVVCANAATVANCDLDSAPDTNFIQNGAPDAVGLRFDGSLIDAVSYEGDTLAPYTEGSGSGLEDGGVNGSISRCPDGADTNQNNVDFVFTGTSTPGAENSCGGGGPGPQIVKIHEVQGNGLTSPLVNSMVVIEGVVVGDFQDGASGVNGDLNGFFVQEEDIDADGDSLTSEGIFVYDGNSPLVNVSIGDVVRVEGAVSEFDGLTEITSFSGVTTMGSASALPTAAVLSLPVASPDAFEAFEGMRVTFPQALVISEYFNYDRYGEIVLTSTRHLTPTAQYEPGPAAILAAQDFLLDKITLDDGRSTQNPDPAIHPNGGIFDLANLFRGGDLLQNVTGVMHQAFGLYRIQPTQGANYINANVRPPQPAPVGGNIKVASFNVLNYFSTLDDGVNDICGPLQNQECRGADDATEFTRQRDKIIAALTAINADVVGLLEIENNINDDAVQDLVDGLNAVNGPGTYDFVHTGVIGSDAIKVAIIYKPASVSLVGNYAILDSSVDPRFIDSKNRPTLAQTFMDGTTGGVFTVAVNHLKSKGSDCNDVGDPDTGDGSGNCNLTRTAAAEALVDWLAGDPTGSGDDDFLIIGDLNSYDKETPIDTIVAAGYTDLIYAYQGESAYSYVFDGQTGYLDYALASPGLLDEVTGVTEWHINADESDLIDYDTSFKGPNQDAIYAPDAYRSSDHDPVIIGLDLCDEIAPVFDEVTVSPDVLWPPNHKYVEVNATVVVHDNFDPNPTVELVSVESNEADDGLGDGDTAEDILIVDNFTVMLRAERSALGSGRVYTLTYLVSDACGNETYATVFVNVPLNQR